MLNYNGKEIEVLTYNGHVVEVVRYNRVVVWENIKEGYCNLSATSGSVTANSGTTTFIVDASGDISVSSSSTAIATASVNGNTVTVTGVGYGSATITVISEATKKFTQASATYEVSVSRAAGYVNLSATSGSMGTGSSLTFTVSSHHGGTLSVASSATGVATVSISGTTVTVKRVTTGSGSATITVTSGQTSKYNSASKTYSVSLSATTITYYVDNRYGISNMTTSAQVRGSFVRPVGDTEQKLYNSGYKWWKGSSGTSTDYYITTLRCNALTWQNKSGYVKAYGIFAGTSNTTMGIEMNLSDTSLSSSTYQGGSRNNKMAGGFSTSSSTSNRIAYTTAFTNGTVYYYV